MLKEPKKFEIVIMSSHGSGITALVRYFALTNCINTFYKAKYRPDRQTLEDFLNNIKEDHKACLCIDSSLYADIFEDIKIYLSKSFTLIDLNRCPYKRFESVINTHLIWWACRVAGLHDLPVKNTGVYATRNVENLICNLATDASMKANIVMFNYLRPMCSNYFFVDTNDITPVNVLNTLTKIFESLSIKNLSLKIPSYEIASRKIRIINDLIPLNISIHGKNIRCRALPSVLLSQFGYTDNDVLITCAKNKLNFFVNKFECSTSFCFVDKIPQSERNMAREFIQNKFYIIEEYCDEINDRFAFSQTLLNNIYFSRVTLINKYAKNFKCRESMISYFDHHISHYYKNNPNYLSLCRDAICALCDLLFIGSQKDGINL